MKQTPLPIIAQVSHIVTRTVDRIMGDRVDYPLMVACACVKALSFYDIQAQVMYGQEAWIEVLENHSVVWAGCWGEHFHFWVVTEFEEIVELNTSVAYRKKTHSKDLSLKALYSPPILWTSEIPNFYRFIPEGIAELELTNPKDIHQYQIVTEEIEKEIRKNFLKKDLSIIAEDLTLFPNEPILCPNRKLLDDSRQTFKYFDRVVSVQGIPPLPEAFHHHSH